MNTERLYVRLRRIAEKIRRMAVHYLGRKKTTYVWDRVPYYREIWTAAAARRELTLTELSDQVWDVRNQDGATLARINNCYVELDDPVTLYVAGHKSVTYSLLEKAGLPVTPYASFTLDTLDTLRQFVESHDGPFVVKPTSGTGSGIGVTTHLRDYGGCRDAAILASLYCRELLVEQFAAGEVYRALVLGGDVVSVVRRTGLRVSTDGTSTLAGLIAAQQPDVWAGRHDDLDLNTTLQLQGLDFDSVPDVQDGLLVKTVADTYTDNREIRTVYTEDVTDQVCAAITDAAAQTARLLRSEFCGVDMILLDPGRPLSDGNGVIGEINTTPGLHHQMKLSGTEAGGSAADRVLDYIISRGHHARG